MDSDSSSQENQESTLHGHGHVQSSKPDIMQLQHLKEITNNFSDERVLGEGGFGVVYKGVLQNGEMVAVKKILQPMLNFLKQFENEVDLLMRLKHANIVRLIGYCYETQNVHMEHNGKFIFAEMPQSLLCLEYLPKGSLDRYISDESSGLDWCTRYKIIEGICNGLQYLHEQIKPIIHLDLKPANILLDDSMVPKVTDFGLSRLLDQEQTMCTLITNGTRGYMPPEYIHGGTITPMSDIFSLGVIILEIVTGHRDYPDVSRTSSDEFIELTVQKWRNVLEKAPACTSLEIYCQEVKRCIQIGLICVNPERTKRPTTTKIIKMLQGLESMDCHTGNEATSPEAQIRPIPRELLDVDPLELIFSLDPDNRTPCLVKLRNKTDGFIAFHFNVLRARTKYCIEPTVGFVWPRAVFNVVVTMEERQELASDFPCIDEFLVQSIVVRVDRVISELITEDTFNNVPCKAVHKVNLAVVYVPPAQPASLLRVGSEEAQASDPLRLEESMDSLGEITQPGHIYTHNHQQATPFRKEPCSSYNMEANRNNFPLYAQDPNDRHAEQIYHGSTSNQDIVASTNYFEETAGPREVRLDDDSQFYRPDQGYSADGDPLPGIEGFEIVGDPRPGITLTACGFPTNGTTLCNFQWVRYLEDGTRQFIEGATIYDYVVTADDVGTLLAVDCTPVDDYGRQGDLVREFANNQNMITCDPDMQSDIDTCISRGRVDFDVFVLLGYSPDEWEEAMLMLRCTSYQVTLKHKDEVIIEEKYSPNLQTKVPNGRTTQFVLVSSMGVNLPFSTQGLTKPNNEDHDVRLRDLIVLVMRTFQAKALDAKRKGKA